MNEAFAVLKLNVARFPQSSNVYDSLGEAYMQAGNRELAATNYRRSLQLDATNTNAIDMLGRLGVKPGVVAKAAISPRVVVPSA